MSQIIYENPENMIKNIFTKKNDNKECTVFISINDINAPGKFYINTINEDDKDDLNPLLNPNENSSKFFDENNKNKIKEIKIKINNIFDLEKKNEYYKKFNDNKSKLNKI